MSSSTFKAHFNMISMNEPVQRKAAFWTSYVRALKGTEDIRANDDNSVSSRRRQQSADSVSLLREQNFSSKTYSSEEPAYRIQAPGYRYQPMSRDTYGYSPRTLNSSSPLNYSTLPRSKQTRK